MKITTWPIDKIDSQGVTTVEEFWTYKEALDKMEELEKKAEEQPGKQRLMIMRIEN